MYSIAEWYIHKHASEPLNLGTTFIADYAQRLGLDPQQTLQAILKPASDGGLGMKSVRLVSYWSKIETSPGIYNFSYLDWQFAMANQYGAKVSLALGLRQPRWPECHQPAWTDKQPASVWQPQLNNFMLAVIDRYKANPALDSYQLENEFFLKIFGTCTNFDRNRLIAEAALVRQTDPNHTLIISRSNNWIGLPIGQPRPDQFGISVYKRVWDYHFTYRYVEYPLPSWFYAFLAGAGQILTGKDMMIHEMQAEPWLPKDQTISNDSGNTLEEQYKSMTPAILKKRIDYAEKTGIKTIELWGAEYWYWLKEKQGLPQEWNIVQQAVSQANAVEP